MQGAVSEFMAGMLNMSRYLLTGFAVGLGLPRDFFIDSFGPEPIYSFRSLRYPETQQKEGWGVAPHTDKRCLFL